MAKTQRAQGASSRTTAERSPGATLAAVPVPAEIAARAYEIWRESGCPEGRSEEHWYAAERELRAQANRTRRP